MLNGRLQKQTLVAILFAVASAAAQAADMGIPAAGPPAAPEVRSEEAPPTEPEAPIEEPAVAEGEVSGERSQRFDDWALDCAANPCHIATRILAADGTEVLRIEAGGQPATLRFTTLLGLHLPDPLVASIGADVERQIPWRTCTPDSGCLADTPLDSELLASLRRERSGTAAFTLVEGLSVRLSFSLIGFTAALRALDGAQ